jgi:hypothetical protein
MTFLFGENGNMPHGKREGGPMRGIRKRPVPVVAVR